ncbi:putative uncharacterized protein ENSP00000383407 isoform X2 [Ovis canadensis]|uniref:putative uncharacterized protein ENSP00000383407 isoform X2 n=1 Tax=Ovis canadensis TaxID=37174 RepID=UPI0037527435
MILGSGGKAYLPVSCVTKADSLPTEPSWKSKVFSASMLRRINCPHVHKAVGVMHRIMEEGSMDSLYEPVPEKQAHQERSSGRTDTFFSPSEDSGRSHSNLFMEVSNFENGKTKRKSIRRSMSESKVFEGKTVNDTIWQEPSKSENDSHIRRLSQLKDLNEDDFLSSHNAHTLQGKKLQGISYQVM